MTDYDHGSEKILMPDGRTCKLNEKEVTPRSKERRIEDQDYIPIIIKRSDELPRHPDDTLKLAIQEGYECHKRATFSLMLSSLTAGLIIGFAALLVAIASQNFPAQEGEFINRLAMAVVYPIGFIICLMSGTELFTEHTASAVYPVLERKKTFKSLLRVWITVLSGNLLGAFLSSLFMKLTSNVHGAGEGFEMVFHHLISYRSLDVFFSAILAGWLMAQGGWIIVSLSSAVGRIICIFLVTFLIGIGGFHHSIAGAAEIFSGFLFSDHASLGAGLSFLLFAIIGNLVGGSFFVAILNYAHIKKSQIS